MGMSWKDALREEVEKLERERQPPPPAERSSVEIVSAKVEGPLENWTPGCPCSACAQPFSGPTWNAKWVWLRDGVMRDGAAVCCSEACARAAGVRAVVEGPPVLTGSRPRPSR